MVIGDIKSVFTYFYPKKSFSYRPFLGWRLSRDWTCFWRITVAVDRLSGLPGEVSSCSYVALDWPIPQATGGRPLSAKPLRWAGFIAWHLGYLFEGMTTEPEAFCVRQACLGYTSAFVGRPKNN